MKTETSKPWNYLLFPFSSVKAGPDCLYAATPLNGIYEIDEEGSWEKLENGMPDEAAVNRLQLQHDLLHACTAKGLYEWDGDAWHNEGLTVPCYQYRKIGGTSYAATEYGLWCRTGMRWELIACDGKKVYDFINLPQYLILAHDSGLSLYDRFMDDWAHFELQASVTSLAVFRGHLIGTSDSGELLVGDKKGAFERIRFGKTFVYSVLARGNSLYACTDRGLYRLVYMAGQVTLLSVQLGYPVTDADLQGGQLHMATLFQGIQTIHV